MHEFHLANQMVKTIHEHIQKNNFSQITKIVIGLGRIIERGEEINFENLKYNIKLFLPKTKIEVKKIPGNKWKLVSIEGEK